MPATIFPTEFAALLWYAVHLSLGCALWPLTRALLPTLADGGYGVAKVLGLFLPALLLWGLGSAAFDIGIFATTGLTLTTPVVGVVYLTVLLVGGGTLWLHRPRRAQIAAAQSIELLCLGTFLLLLLARAFSPEIFWGEKPMDFTFLNYLVRVEQLPPQEPWAVGFSMQYYYGGVFALAKLMVLSGIDSAVGYNLALASTGMLVVGALCTVVLAAGLRLRVALFGAAVIGLGGNPEILRILLSGERPLGFDLFWASSRLFTSPSISEYPIWSVLFGDLHAHVIAMPLSAAMLVWWLLIARGESGATRPRAMLAAGLFLGALFWANSWDFVAHTAFALLALVVQQSPSWRSYFVSIGRALLSLGCGAALVVIPVLLLQPRPFSAGFGVVYGDYHLPLQMLWHFGAFLIPAAFALLLCGESLGADRGVKRGALVLAAVLLPVGCSVWFRQQGVLTEPLFIFIPAVLWGMGVAVCGRGAGVAFNRAAVFLPLAAGAVLIGSEFFYLMDRMNTIFKFYLPVWFMLGVFSLLMIERLAQAGTRFALAAAALSVLTLSMMFAGTLVAFASTVLTTRTAVVRPTLDGMAYLNRESPDERALFNFLRSTGKAEDTVLEAFGSSYGPYTRVAMNTGLPTVLGWEYHLQQRAIPRDDIERRKADITMIYSTTSRDETVRLLRRYRVRWVVVGALERELYRRNEYAAVGLEKFSSEQDLFEVAFRSGSEVVYRVLL